MTNHQTQFYLVVLVKLLKYLYQILQLIFFKVRNFKMTSFYYWFCYYKLPFFKASLHCNLVPVENFEPYLWRPLVTLPLSCPCHSPDAADSTSFDVQLGDIILTATDGLFDNMPDYMILQELKKLKVINSKVGSWKQWPSLGS